MMRQQSNLPRLAPIAAFLLATGASVGTAQAQDQLTVLDVPALEPVWATDEVDATDDGTNALTVNPDSQEGRTYIYPNPTDRQADELGAGDGTGSVAYISWLLDNETGRAPGIQTVTDDGTFNLNNCIMASGEPGAKTCGDDQSSSKRYKLWVTSPDAAVDLVFDTRTKEMEYDAATITPGEDTDGDGVVESGDVEVGRIYRVLQKMINDTDERIQRVELQLGYYTTDPVTGEISFTEFTVGSAGEDIGFELRPSVERTFFGQDNTNTRDVWLENEFAQFSPAMFGPGTDPRFDVGYYDNEAAGLFPPQDVDETAPASDILKSSFIDSGTSTPVPDNSGGLIEGATTLNYFRMELDQAAGANLPAPSPFGYLLPDTQLPTGIYEYENSNLTGEGELRAWWDGNDWRYGQADNFGIVPDAQLVTWAEDPVFATGLIDDLGSLNMDFFIYMGDDFLEDDGTGTLVPKQDNIVLRLTAKTEAADVPGTEDPLWTQAGNEPPSLDSYLDDDTSTAVGGGGGGGCTIGANRPFDPLLPGLALAALAFLGLRRRWNA